MFDIHERHANAIKNGIIYAQVEPYIEGFGRLELDIRSQAEVRVAAQIVLKYQISEMLRNGITTHSIDPFQASHAITPRKINGLALEEYAYGGGSYSTPCLAPANLRPILDELLSRGWEQAIQEHGYVFNRSDGLAYAVEKAYKYCPDVFDPVILEVTEPIIKDRKNPTKSEQKVIFAFEQLEYHLTGGWGLFMKRFNPKNLIIDDCLEDK